MLSPTILRKIPFTFSYETSVATYQKFSFGDFKVFTDLIETFEAVFRNVITDIFLRRLRKISKHFELYWRTEWIPSPHNCDPCHPWSQLVILAPTIWYHQFPVPSSQFKDDRMKGWQLGRMTGIRLVTLPGWQADKLSSCHPGRRTGRMTSCHPAILVGWQAEWQTHPVFLVLWQGVILSSYQAVILSSW